MLRALRPRELAAIVALFLGSACVDLGTNTSGNLAPPAITTQPKSESVTVGTPATLSVVATGDSLAYQWFREGAIITGATAASYTIASAKLSDAGAYQVMIANAAGTVVSDSAVLAVTVPASIVAYRLTSGASSSTNERYTSTSADESAVLVSTGAQLTLINPTVEKQGRASDPVTSAQTGTDAALLAATGASVLVLDGVVDADSTGASAVSAVGQGTTVEMYRTAVSLEGGLGAALAATAGSVIHAEAVHVTSASGLLASAVGGGRVELIVAADTLSGDLSADASSGGRVELRGGAALTGAIQNMALALDSASTWTVRANSALTSVVVAAGISGNTLGSVVGNGFTVSYAASDPANAWLGGRTNDLAGGGMLVPR